MYPVLFASLSPLLWLQGKWVRYRTESLPEPEGNRLLTSAGTPTKRILIAGDSAAAGVGVHTQDEALLGLVHGGLNETFCIQSELVAETGLKSPEVLQRMHEQAQKGFDLVVFSVGVNDVTGLTPKKAWRRNIENMVALFQKHNPDVWIIFSSLPPMENFMLLPQPLRYMMGQRAKRMDAELATVISKHRRCVHLTTPFPLTAPMLASDLFHPGAPAYKVWAQALVEEITRCFQANE